MYHSSFMHSIIFCNSEKNKREKEKESDSLTAEWNYKLFGAKSRNVLKKMNMCESIDEKLFCTQ